MKKTVLKQMLEDIDDAFNVPAILEVIICVGLVAIVISILTGMWK